MDRLPTGTSEGVAGREIVEAIDRMMIQLIGSWCQIDQTAGHSHSGTRLSVASVSLWRPPDETKKGTN